MLDHCRARSRYILLPETHCVNALYCDLILTTNYWLKPGSHRMAVIGNPLQKQEQLQISSSLTFFVD